MSLHSLPRNPKFKAYFTPSAVKTYLDKNPQVVEEFILSSTSTEFLEKVVEEKRRLMEEEEFMASQVATPLPRRRQNGSYLYTDTGMDKMCRKINSCKKDADIHAEIYNLCGVLSMAFQADKVLLFVVDSTENLCPYTPGYGNKNKTSTERSTCGTLPAFIAKEKKPLNIENVHLDDRFPKGTGEEKAQECHAICVPVLLESGDVYCVVEFVRHGLQLPFDEQDFELANCIFTWIMSCVQKSKMNRVR